MDMERKLKREGQRNPKKLHDNHNSDVEAV